MKYELETLDTLIISGINPSTFKDPKHIDAASFRQFKTLAQTETDRVKKAFAKEAFSQNEERYIERYMQHHQSELIRLTDHLLGYLPDEEALYMYDFDHARHSTVNLYKYVYNCLEDLISYIEKHFSRYFNPDAKIPDSYKLIAIRDIQELLPAIEGSFNQKGLNPRLQSIILSPLKAFIRDKTASDTSFLNLIYLKNFSQELLVWSDSNLTDQELNHKIICIMVYLNFNSYKLFALCTESIISSYQEIDTLAGQIERLAWYSKNINQAQVKPGFAYKPGHKSLRDCLIQWIDEEICFLEKRQQLTLNLPLSKVEGLQDDFKFNTSLSVAQLAYFIRILLEENILLNRNQKEVLKFIARFTRTKKAESVSPESLRTRFYNVESSTKDAVKDVIIRLLNHIRK